MSENVYIFNVGMIKFGKHIDKSIKQLVGWGFDEVLKDNNNILKKEDIEAAWFSMSGWQIQPCIRGQVFLSANGFDKKPITNVENACASGSTAFHGAWTAIKAGIYDCVLAIGAEKMYYEDAERKKEGMSSFIGGTDVERTTAMIEQLKKIAAKKKAREAKKQGIDPSQLKKKEHSAFMDLYALAARNHMKKYGLTQRQLAVIAAKNHNNSTMNPLAQYTFPQTVEQVMEDYEVSYPLTRSMCAPIGDGVAAAILVSEKFLEQHPISREILVRASVLRSGSWVEETIANRTSNAAYKMSGLTPQDIDVVEVHDATAFGEIHQTEQMGFCPIGKGGEFAESGATAIGGEVPVNPSGGLISRGHPIGASGLAQIYELVQHLRNEAGKRQVKNAKIALAENGGGNIGAGEAAMCVHILEKV